MSIDKKKSVILGTVIVAMIAVMIILVSFLQANSYLEAKTLSSEIIRLESKETEISKKYNVVYQEKINKQIQKLKKSKTYTEKDMLLIYNPYELNVQSMYVYFTTKDAARVQYKVHVEDDKIRDFSAVLNNGGTGNYSKKHEYQLIGLIPEVKNTVTFEITYKNGKKKIKQFSITPDALTGTEYQILPSIEGTSKQELSNGLYAVFSENKYLYYYDNDGVIRSEIPILSYRAVRLLFNEDKMYYSISKSKIAQMNRFGQITNVYDLGRYHLHHDYVFDGDGNLLILGTDTLGKSVEDIILRLDLATGKVKKIIDLAKFFPDYYKEHMKNKKPDGKYDWMHLNTIQWIKKDNSIILSARETSAIIKIKNIDKKPKIEYMLSEESFWKGTGYEKLLYQKVGDFRGQTGQHTVTYEEDDSLGKGQYYLHMFNNNIGKSYSRPDYDWNANFDNITDHGTKGDTSYYYRYLVDETKKTYELIDSYKVDYSGYVSSTQHYENNHIVDSGQVFTLIETDNTGELIRKFELTPEGKYCYRVYKYNFEGFYFSELIGLE